MAIRSAALVAVLLSALISACTMNPGRPVDTAPIDVPLAKIAQPAFARDFADRNVRFEASFSLIMAVVADLPPEYKNDFIRIGVQDNGTYMQDIVVPKGRADILFSLKQGQRIRITAYAQYTVLTTLIGSQAQKLLLVANSVETIGPAPKAPAAAAKPKQKHKPKPK